MMTTTNKVLIGALVAQVGLAAVTRIPSGGPTAPRDLVGFPSDQLAMIRITGRLSKGADAQVPEPPIELRKQGTGWVLASSDGFPASDEMMKPLLEAVDMLDVREPVATSEMSAVNLEVSAERYTRKVELESVNGDKRTLYIGAAQGKSAHVRVDGEPEVYTVRGFNAWTMSEQANRYFDREYLKVDPATVTAVTVARPGQPELALSKADDGTWTLASAPGEAVDASAASAYIGKLLTVRMTDPSGSAATPEMKLGDDAQAVVTWTTGGDSPETHSYRVGTDIPSKTGRLYFRDDVKPFTVEVMKANLKSALEPNPNELLADAVIDLDGPGGMPGGMPGMPPGGMPGHGAPPGAPPGHGKAPHGAP